MAEEMLHPGAVSLDMSQRLLDQFAERYREDPFFKERAPLAITRQIGRGGSGEVFLIVGSNRTRYALKVIEAQSPEEFRRKNREIETRKKLLDIPFLIYYYGYGTIAWQRRYYYLIFMPFFESTCDSYERISPFDEDRVLEMAIDVSLGLSICHEKGIIHRDIKPGNIFVSEPERFEVQDIYKSYIASKKHPVYLLGDFSNAKDTTEDGGGATVVMATHGFEPPEIADSPSPTPQYDIYSLGAVLYWRTSGMMTAGTTDYTRDEARNQGSRFRQRPPLGSDELWRIICKATQIDPVKRYPTALALRQDLLALRDRRRAAAQQNTAAYQAEHGAMAEKLRQAEQEKKALHEEIANLKRMLAQKPAAPAHSVVPGALSYLRDKLRFAETDGIIYGEYGGYIVTFSPRNMENEIFIASSINTQDNALTTSLYSFIQSRSKSTRMSGSAVSNLGVSLVASDPNPEALIGLLHAMTTELGARRVPGAQWCANCKKPIAGARKLVRIDSHVFTCDPECAAKVVSARAGTRILA